MSAPSAPRFVLASLAAGGLWLIAATLRGVSSRISGGAAEVATVIPNVVPLSVWLWPGAWPAVTVAVGVAAMAAIFALYTALGRGGTSSVVGAWLAAVAAGGTVGLAFDLAAGWTSVMIVGPRGLLGGEFGATAAAGALWGLVVGWMPGLIAARGGLAPAAPARVRRSRFAVAAGLAVVAVVAVGIAGNAAQRVHYEAEAEAEAVRQHEAANGIGAPPDPAAQGDPVPPEVAASVPSDPQWCTAERATLLLGGSDGATGHRIQSVQLMNFSDAPCVIEGYPDIAFGDQNSHLLDVTIEHGSSFMTSDLGAQRIEVPPGGYAVASLGWDAASTHGALVGATLWAAPVAGMTRGSWPVELDIVEGATLAVTAWQLQTGVAGSAG